MLVSFGGRHRTGWLEHGALTAMAATRGQQGSSPSVVTPCPVVVSQQVAKLEQLMVRSLRSSPVNRTDLT